MKAKVLLATLLAIATALRFTHLDRQSLWLDEGFTLAFARTASPSEVLRKTFECDSTECLSPLYPLLLHPFISWLGDSVYVLRGFSAACGLATVIAMYFAARAMFDHRTGLVAVAGSSISAYAVWYSQDARSYSLSLLLVALVLWSLALCLRQQPAPSWSARLALAVTMSLGILSNILFVTGSVALFASHLPMTGSVRRWWRIWWPAFVAGSLPLLYFFAAKAGSGAHASEVVTPLAQHGMMNVVYTAYGLLVGTTFGPPQSALRGADKLQVLADYVPALASAGTLAVLVLIAIVSARHYRARAGQQWVGAELLSRSVLVAAALSVIVGIATGVNWQPRHSFFAFPLLVLVSAVSVSELAAARQVWLRLVAVAAFGLFSVANLWSLHGYFTQGKYAKDDYRGAARYLVGAQRLGQRSALLSGQVVLLRYYGDELTADLTEVGGERLLDSLEQLARPEGRILAAINREFGWQRGIGIAAVAGERFTVRKLITAQNFDIYSLSVQR